jgi:hypothetical protein
LGKKENKMFYEPYKVIPGYQIEIAHDILRHLGFDSRIENDPGFGKGITISYNGEDIFSTYDANLLQGFIIGLQLGKFGLEWLREQSIRKEDINDPV